MSLQDSIDRRLIKRKLWNNPEFAVEESLLGMAMINRGLIVLDGCQAILRKDYDNIPGKVKIITGGGAGNEPAYAGFVGPGMLTASISGGIYSSPSSHSILKLIEEIGTDHTPGVLIIIENRSGYRINFATAVLRAENKDLNVKLILAGKGTFPKHKQYVEECIQSSILFLLKIAGAMAEEGRSIYEIYTVCNRIATSGEIASISVGIQSSTQNLSPCSEMEIGHGTHGESGVLKLPFSSLKNTVSILLKLILKVDSKENSECFVKGHQIAVIVNNTGGCSQLETNIFAMEVLQQLSDLKFVVARTYVGTMMSVLDHRGFQIGLIDLSFNSNIIKYLDEPVKAPAWPRPFSLADVESSWESAEKIITSGRYVKDNVENLEVQPLGPSMNRRSAQAFLTILTFACEALSACTDQVNIMDEEFGDGDCGTTLSNGAKAIKAAVKEKEILGVNPYETFTQISKILEQKMGGLQGGLYSLFFQAIAKVFSKCSKEDSIDAFLWLKAFSAANKTISEFGGANEGDRTMLDPLLSAQRKLECALSRNCHPIQAFGEAVRVAEECASKTIDVTGPSQKTNKYPDPGAHAVGIWMRAAYEGVKLKFSCECEAAI